MRIFALPFGKVIGIAHMGSTVKISVLLPKQEAERFEGYCRQEGYKKSTLVARLIREHLDKHAFHMQMDFLKSGDRDNNGKE